jgi:hypothetical protein
MPIQLETSRAYCLVVTLRPLPRGPLNMYSPGFLPALLKSGNALPPDIR